MNKDKRMEQAMRWFILHRDARNGGELQRMTLHRWWQRWMFRRWMRCRENVAAFLTVAAVHALVERWVLEERTSEAVSSNVVPLFDEERSCTRPPTVSAAPVMSRRQLAATFAGLAVGVGVGVGVGGGVLTSVFGARRRDVLASGHVLQVALRDGVMQAARNTAFRLHPGSQAHTVHLLAGQAAFDLWPRARTTTRVTTSLGEILATGARFAVRAFGSLVEITVAAGSARVFPTALGASAVELRAGQQMTLRRETASAEVIAGVDAERELAWTQGTFNFDGETFGEAAAAFNLFNELQIDLSPDVASLPVGTHQCSLTDPQLFLRRIAPDLQLEIRRDGQLIRVSKRNDAPGTR
jgi:transmembrane sensor